jgi:twitching motility protein PilT
MSEIRPLLDRLLAECLALDASDVHLAAGLNPYLRVHGVLEPRPDYGILEPATMAGLAAELVGSSRFVPADARPIEAGFATGRSDVHGRTIPLDVTGSLDGAFTATTGHRYRFNVFRRQGTLAVALRRLEDRFRTLGELGLPEQLYELCDASHGLVAVCGPTGSGKSTTLATLIDRINQSRRCHIVTIEDPIEYLHASAQSLVNQRQVGSDASSFNDALVASLRQDPDVILVGEIRDLNTIRTAITAAETGHLVLTTVHAGDCVGAIERLVSVFPADEQSGVRRQLGMVLRAVVTQHLLVADGTAGMLESNRRRRVVASEVLMNNGAVANLIATGKTNQLYSSLETGGALGMRTLEQDLARLWMQNWITEHTAVSMARTPQSLRDHAKLLKNPSLGKPGGMR